jgi:hypothetical protein
VGERPAAARVFSGLLSLPRPHRSSFPRSTRGKESQPSIRRNRKNQCARKPRRWRPIPAKTMTSKRSIIHLFQSLGTSHGVIAGGCSPGDSKPQLGVVGSIKPGESNSRGPWTVVVGARITVPAPASQILLHLRDCTRDGVSIIAQRRQQISSLDEFGNHLTGGRLEGGPNDFTHGTRQIFIFRSVETLRGN